MRRFVACLIAAAFACSAPARADIWGYVDENGVAHVATEKLDARYQLFFKGAPPVAVPDPAVGADAMATAAAEAQAGEIFKRTPIYQRLTNHPNVKRFAPLIERHAKEQQLDPALVRAVIAAESAFETDALSPKGAIGLMQIMPATGERYGVVGDGKRTTEQKLYDPATNVRVGTRYLRDLLAMFANDVTLALAAYNAGEQTVKRYDNAVPPYPETREYVKLVQQLYAVYRPPPPPKPPPAKPVRNAPQGQRKLPSLPPASNRE